MHISSSSTTSVPVTLPTCTDRVAAEVRTTTTTTTTSTTSTANRVAKVGRALHKAVTLETIPPPATTTTTTTTTFTNVRAAVDRLTTPVGQCSPGSNASRLTPTAAAASGLPANSVTSRIATCSANHT